jgi:hypothetical protein
MGCDGASYLRTRRGLATIGLDASHAVPAEPPANCDKADIGAALDGLCGVAGSSGAGLRSGGVSNG